MIIDSPLETQRFNIKAGKIIIDHINEIERSLRTARAEGYDLLTCRVSTKDLFLLQALEREGFFLTDTLLYYRTDISSGDSAADDWASPIRDEKSIQQVREVVSLAFKGYPSHYSMDKNLNPERCEEIYEDWALRSCRDRTVATEVLGRFEDGKLVAFLSVKDHMSHGEVLLAAVHPLYQGQGLLQKLLSASVSWARQQGHHEIFYSTQIQNIAAQKALIRKGWEISHSFYTLHCWINQGGQKL
nr:hypothetical protein CKG001_14750 [Bdellovibrio sp. CKG001]